MMLLPGEIIKILNNAITMPLLVSQEPTIDLSKVIDPSGETIGRVLQQASLRLTEAERYRLSIEESQRNTRKLLGL